MDTRPETRFAGASAIWVSERSLQLAAALASQLVFMQALGKTAFGELGYILAVISLLLPLCHFGVASLVTAALLRDSQGEAGIFTSALFCRSVGWVFSLFFCLIFLWLVPHEREVTVLILILCIAQFFSVYQVLEYRHQIDRQPWVLVRLRGVVTLIFLMTKLAILLGDVDLRMIVALIALELVANGFCQIEAYRRRSGVIAKPSPSGPYIGWFFRRAPVLLASSVLAVLYLKLDVVMLQQLSTPSEVGRYVAAVRISEAWYSIPPLIVASVFPGLWALRSDPKRWAQLGQVTLDGLVALGLLAIVGVLVIGEGILGHLSGGQYRDSLQVLVVHAWAGIFIAVRAFVSQWLTSEELLLESLISHAIGAAVNIGLNLWWIPVYGALGAAFATLVAYGFSSWIAFLILPNTRALGMQISRSLVLPFRPQLLVETLSRIIFTRAKGRVP